MRPAPFAYARPADTAEASALLQGLDDPIALAGGQSLMPALARRDRRAGLLVDLTRLADLRGIGFDGHLSIGAGEPMWDVERSRLVAEHAPLLCRALRTVGAPSIRSRATLGGSIAWCDPTSQLPATLLALGTTVITNYREVVLEDLLQGPFTTALRPGEVLLRLRIASQAGFCTGLKHVRRTHIVWPTVGCAVSLRVVEDRIASAAIALYGAATKAVTVPAAQAVLVGQRTDLSALPEVIQHAMVVADPFDDERATAAYRRQVLPVLIGRALREALVQGEEA